MTEFEPQSKRPRSLFGRAPAAAILYAALTLTALRVLVFVAGVVIVLLTLGSAVRVVILPRGVPSRIIRFVFIVMRWLFQLRMRRSWDYRRRDYIMAFYAPISLLATLVVWITLVGMGYTLMYWALGAGFVTAVELSGSSIFTLGFFRPTTVPAIALSYTEAAIGLLLLALLITYLPSIYGAFSRREAAVTALEVRAGSPPSATEMLWRYWVIGRFHQLDEIWRRWEEWFVDIEETHTSFPSLVFFRSPQPDHSWVTASGAVLDGAALFVSSVDGPRDAQAEIMVRAGYLALRRIADFFGIAYDPDPRQGDPVSIMRHEFDEALDRLAEAGLSLKSDRDQAWLDFAGWRVNYDSVLLTLAGLTMAPYAPWSSDRSLRDFRPRLFSRLGRRNRAPAGATR
jgi:hypothetical protein